MFELLAIGTVGFWIILSIAMIIIFISLEFEEWGGTRATWTIIILCVLLYFFGADEIFKNVWYTLKENPSRVFSITGIYVGVGTIWSFVKWYFFLLNKRDEIKESLERNPNMFIQIPEAKNYKGRIISWMCYWPFSGIWTLINDPVKRFFQWVYGRFNNLYQLMSDNMFKDIKSQIENNKNN